MAKSFFNPQNSLWHWIGKLPELIILSFLWGICSLPVLTLIPASIALYDAVARNLRPDEKGLYRRFLRTFWKELGRGVLLSLFWLVLAFFFATGYRVVTTQSPGTAQALIYQVSMLLPIGVFLWEIPLESRFFYGFWTLQKTAVQVFLSFLPYSVLMLAITALGLVGCFYVPVLTVIMPALLALLNSLIIEKVFSKLTREEE